MRRPSALTALLVLLQPLALAGDPPVLRPGQPAEVGVDAEGLDAALSIVRRAVEADELAGAVVLVARQGRVILHEALGHRDVAREQPMTKDALFRMASNSKAVTAAGILLLVEQDKLELDAPVGRYLPAFDVEAWQAVTLRHLLTHTSGSRIEPLFLTPLTTPTAEDPGAPRLVNEVSRFAAIAPVESPGATYSYCNAGYNMLAAVIEQVSGSYKQHLRTQLYEPLGMDDSCNHEPDADLARMSCVQRRGDDGVWRARWTPGDAPDWPFPRGSGGMVTSAWDFAVFCQMLLNGGEYDGERVLSAETVTEMTRPQAPGIPAAERYGLGWVVSEPGGVFLHSGSDGTYVWVDPADELIGMLLTQCQGTEHPRKVLRDAVKRACEAPEPAGNGR